ncbi:hypothetical protein HOC80_00270, partial [archaeon]|nr:hypothetical protein [archaeon]
AYNFTGDKKYKFFSLSFLLISLANLVFWFFTSLLVLHVSPRLSELIGIFDFPFLAYTFLSLIAYMILLIIALKIDSKKIMLLLMSLSFLFVLFSKQNFLKFHITAFLLLFFLSYQFYTNYLENKKINAKVVFTSFYLLTCSEIFYIATVYSSNIFYVVAQALQLIAYLTLFYLFLRLINYGRKKRKT